MIVGITISCGLFVFSQSHIKVFASLTNVGSLAVGAFDFVNCSMSVAGFVLVFNVDQISVVLNLIHLSSFMISVQRLFPIYYRHLTILGSCYCKNKLMAVFP